MLGVASMMLTAVALGNSVTNVLTSNGSANREAFNNAWYWARIDTSERGAADKGSNTPLDPDTDYLVQSSFTCSSPNKASETITFGGRSLTLGTGSAVGNFRIYSYRNANLVFNAPGIFFNRGTFSVEGSVNNIHRMSGVMTIQSPAGSPYVFKSSYTNMTLLLDAAMYGGSGVGASIFCSAGKEPFCVDLANASSEYEGAFTVYSDRAALFNGRPPIQLKLCATPFGAVEVRAFAQLGAHQAGDAVEVKRLTLLADACLDVSTATRTVNGEKVVQASRFVATESLALPASGKVHLRLPYMIHRTDELSIRVPVLTAPAGTVDKTKFDLVPVEGAFLHPYALDVATEQGVDNLYVVATVTEPVVSKLVTDAGGMDANRYDSGLTNAVRWSDGQAPHAGASYLVMPVSGAAVDLRTLYDVHGSYVFPGLSLTIGSGCGLYTFVNSLTVTNLTLLDGAKITQGQWSPSLNLYGEGDGISLPSGTVYLESHDTHTMYFRTPLAGSAKVVIRGNRSTSAPPGNTRLETASPNFTGTWHLTSHWIGSAGWKGIFANPVQNQTLMVATPDALGAPLAAFDPMALTIDTYGEFIVPETMTFADTTRGIYLGKNAQIRVPAGKTATFLAQRTFAGETFVRQSGTLALGGAVRFGKGAAIVDEPQAQSNLLTFVEGGSLKALSAGCVDGVTVTFSNATSRLLLDADTADADLLANGVRNVKTDTPFVFPDGATLKVDFGLAGATPLDGSRAHRLGIATVSAAAAAALRGKLEVTVPRSVYDVSARQDIRESADQVTGDVTFWLHLRPKGMRIDFR